MCNQSLMKLVIPEDDETDEGKQSLSLQMEPKEESLSQQQVTSSGESLFIVALSGWHPNS